MGKQQTFTVPIRGIWKALEIGTFLYLSGVLHLIGRCHIGGALR